MVVVLGEEDARSNDGAGITAAIFFPVPSVSSRRPNDSR